MGREGREGHAEHVRLNMIKKRIDRFYNNYYYYYYYYFIIIIIIIIMIEEFRADLTNIARTTLSSKV